MPTHVQADVGANLHNFVQAIVTVLVVINPVGTIFSALTSRLAPAQRGLVAIRVALSILIILVTSALIGLRALSIFNISLDVFRIVGGMIVAYMGFDMLSGQQTVGQASPTNFHAEPTREVRRNCLRTLAKFPSVWSRRPKNYEKFPAKFPAGREFTSRRVYGRFCRPLNRPPLARRRILWK